MRFHQVRLISVGLFAILSAVHVSSATQLAVMRSRHGLLVGANTWSGMRNLDGTVATGTPICKIMTAGRFAVLVIGNHERLYRHLGPGESFSNNPAWAAWLRKRGIDPDTNTIDVGDVIVAIRRALHAGDTFSRNEESIITAVVEALRQQMDAKDLFHDLHTVGTDSGVELIFAGAYPDRVTVRLIRIEVKDWVLRSFTVTEPKSLPQGVGQAVKWFHYTPWLMKSRVTDPQPKDLIDVMNSVVDESLPDYKTWVAPPFVVGELRSDGMHWIGSPGPCALSEAGPTTPESNDVKQ